MCNPHLHPRKSDTFGKHMQHQKLCLESIELLRKKDLLVQTISENTQIESNWKYRHIQLYK